jgi:hypothetical protein
MPFININIVVATKILDEIETLEELLKTGQINPKEFDILKLLHDYSQASDDSKEEIKNSLQKICIISFEKDAQRSFELLIKFAEKRQNVSWVLFSRSQQYIKYTEKNPLEGYLPRKNEIIKKLTKFKLLKS